jgi:CheY-like chemotaxis protein
MISTLTGLWPGPVQPAGKLFMARVGSLSAMDMPVSWLPTCADHLIPKAAPAFPQTAEIASVYAIDDKADLTELYALLLAGAGYRVRTFNDRAEALTALKAQGRKPDLLITNYLGRSMPIGQFMQACRVIHPSLRILMASGYHETDLHFSRVSRPLPPEALYSSRVPRRS